METSSALIGLLLIVLFIGPIIYIIYIQSTKDKRSLKHLRSLGMQHSITLDHFELGNSLILGLDSKAKKLLIVEPQNNMQYSLVDLYDIRTSNISKIGHQEVKDKIKREIVTHVSLELIKGNSEKVSEIVFYDEDDNTSYDADSQMVLAKKWDNLIKHNLSA